MVRILVPTLTLIITAGSLVLPAQRFTPAEGSDPLHVAFDQLLDPNVRDGLVYYRAMKSERGPAGSVRRGIERAGGDLRRVDEGSADRVLAERLQRVRAADGDRQLPDSRPQRGRAGLEHQADSRGVRSDQASRRRAQRDARRDREDDPAGVQGRAALPRARARRDRQRPPAQRGLYWRAAEAATGVDRSGVRQRSADARDRSHAPTRSR